MLGAERTAREMTVPALHRGDATSGIEQYKRLSRDSGAWLDVGGGLKINTGMYGLTDLTLDPRVRAQGLYIPNFDDIQHPENRAAVKDEWLQRNKQNPGWFMGRYTPSVRTANSAQLRPITEVILTDSNGDGSGRPIIRVIATYPDTAQQDVPAASTTEPGYFYDLTWNAGTPTVGTLGNPRQIRDFDYPKNGVLYAEGSIRIRGRVGTGNEARQLTVVSAGTIYVEGNVIKSRPDCFVGLMAQDNVCVNPTAFTRLQFNGDWLPNPAGDGVIMQQNSDVDVTVDDADGFGGARVNGVPDAYVHLRQSAMAEDTNSETAVHLFLRGTAAIAGRTLNRYKFSANNPANWPAGINPPPRRNRTGGRARRTSSSTCSTRSLRGSAELGGKQLPDPAQPERAELRAEDVLRAGGAVHQRPGQVPAACGPKDGDPLAPNQQATSSSRVAVLPTDRPLQVRVEAMVSLCSTARRS